jgi:hypothetical protein
MTANPLSTVRHAGGRAPPGSELAGRASFTKVAHGSSVAKQGGGLPFGNALALPKHEEHMDHTAISIRASLALLLCLSKAATGQSAATEQSPAAKPPLHATHVLGFEAAHHNASGDLGIHGDALQFQSSGRAAAQVGIRAIQNVSLGQEDVQRGGTAATVTKAAIPFGGGRAVSLFAHSKFDALTIEYLDQNGAVHEAVFLLNKGQGQAFQNELAAKGVHVVLVNPTTAEGTPEVKQ